MIENSDIEAKAPPQSEAQRPKTSAIDNLIAFSKRADKFMRMAVYKIGHIEQANMELGIKQLKSGNYFDATVRFKIVLLVNKTNAIAHYLLGKTYCYRNKFTEAVSHLQQALRLQPDFDEAKFILACCGQRVDIKMIPRSFIIEKQDLLSVNYDNFVPTTSARVNSVLAEEFRKILGDQMGFTVLDLGCRGGDTSQMMRKNANSIIGVEPSLKLVAIARNRRIDNLLTFNLIFGKFPEDYVKESLDKFQIVLSTYYLDNLGPLDDYFTNVMKVLDKGSFFAFNIARHDTKEDFLFHGNEMIFTHSAKLYRKIAGEIFLKNYLGA